MRCLTDPESITLMKVSYETYTNEDLQEAFSNEVPEDELIFDAQVEILGENEDGYFTIWDLEIDYHPFFYVRAVYNTMVFTDEDSEIDEDDFTVETYFPIVCEFAFLTATLSRTIIGVPFVLDPFRLIDLVFDLDEED